MASGIMATGHGLIARHQILARLAEETGETVNLVVAQEQGMFYIDRVETNWPMRVQLPIGTHVPFHCTASGKVFLSSLSRPRRERLLASLDLERLTPNTITSQSVLLEEVSQVRARDYAIDDEEFVEGMAAVAVPVCAPGGAFFAAVAVHGPTRRFSAAAAAAAKDLLKAAAARLETVLF
jgi:DNA-binding IclR family transcriptional regulator